MAASNTNECFTERIGQRVVGVLFNACPAARRDIAAGTKTLVFNDGTGLTFASNGSFWSESINEIDRAIEARRAELERCRAELEGELFVAGAIQAGK